ncbi:MAG: UDP-N-acetylmuramoyl-L-alanine--D-glutamate ligase [Lautropia sp.]|nr:UDP-N-acetylmuramoyl-L-alanine--D-glutamate ligase [Lautropia sp.]
MIELGQQRAAVIGLGESGLAMARWLARKGASVQVFDDRAEPPGLAALREAVPGAVFACRPLDAGLLDGEDAPTLLAWSPGVSIVTGSAAALHAAAQARGVPVLGELDFFMDEVARQREAGHAARVVAITGTNGKTTVTRMTAFLANEAGVEAEAAGNIGPSMLDAMMRRLDAGTVTMPALWVLELSSFQLAVAQPPACDASVVLNITPDHLDWHGTMQHYRAAKLRIHDASGRRIINLDDALADPDLPAPWDQPAPQDEAAPGKGRARRKPEEAPPPRPRTDFLLRPPTTAPAFGLVREGGLAWLTEAMAEEGTGGRRRRAEPVNILLNRLMPAEALRVQGAHNHANVLAALGLLRACGVPMAAMLHALRAFVPDDHRCAPAGIVGDIEYINDSKGTNIGATVAALEGLGRRAVLIAGGVGKDQDFSLLAPAVAAHARAVVLIGRDAALLKAALQDTGVPLHEAADMDAAVQRAASLAQAGDVVLLSPACASFDMFSGYAERGRVFVEAVQRLATEAGQPC